MNRRISRLLRPGVGVYLSIMAIFCAATLISGHYFLAAVEAAIILAAFAVYALNRSQRDRRIQRYLRAASNGI